MIQSRLRRLRTRTVHELVQKRSIDHGNRPKNPLTSSHSGLSRYRPEWRLVNDLRQRALFTVDSCRSFKTQPVVGTSSWAFVRPGPDSDPGYTLVAPSALKSAYFGALRKKQLVDRQNRLNHPLTKYQRRGRTIVWGAH
jgi:hypothetical protein